MDRARVEAPSRRAASIDALERATCVGALACELRDRCVDALRRQLSVNQALDRDSALLRGLDEDDDDAGRDVAQALDRTESAAREAERASASCLALEARARR